MTLVDAIRTRISGGGSSTSGPEFGSGPLREIDPRESKIRRIGDPFSGLTVDTAHGFFNTSQQALILSISRGEDENRQRGAIFVQGDQVTVLMPSALAFDPNTQAYAPARYARLQIGINGITALEFNLSMQATDESLFDASAQMDQRHQANLNAAMDQKTAAVSPLDFGHAEVQEVLWALREAQNAATAQSEMSLLAPAGQSSPIQERIAATGETINQAIALVQANREQVAERLLPAANTFIAPTGSSITTEGATIGFSLRDPHATDPGASSIAVEASIRLRDGSFLGDDPTAPSEYQAVNYRIFNSHGDLVAFSVDTAGGVHTSLGGRGKGMVPVDREQDTWVTGIMGRLIDATRHVATNIEHGIAQKTVAGLDNVETRYKNEKPPRKPVEADKHIVPAGWRPENITVKTMAGLSINAELQVALKAGDKTNAARVIIEQPTDGKYFADLQIIQYAQVGNIGSMPRIDVIRILHDGTLRVFDGKRHVKPTPAQQLALREFIRDGVVPAIKARRTKEIAEAISLLDRAKPFLGPRETVPTVKRSGPPQPRRVIAREITEIEEEVLTDEEALRVLRGVVARQIGEVAELRAAQEPNEATEGDEIEEDFAAMRAFMHRYGSIKGHQAYIEWFESGLPIPDILADDYAAYQRYFAENAPAAEAVEENQEGEEIELVSSFFGPVQHELSSLVGEDDEGERRLKVSIDEMTPTTNRLIIHTREDLEEYGLRGVVIDEPAYDGDRDNWRNGRLNVTFQFANGYTAFAVQADGQIIYQPDEGEGGILTDAEAEAFWETIAMLRSDLADYADEAYLEQLLAQGEADEVSEMVHTAATALIATIDYHIEPAGDEEEAPDDL